MKQLRTLSSVSRKVSNSSGKISLGATEYQGSEAISCSSVCGFGSFPEIAVGEVVDFIVVVEHNPAVAGHAEVLEQQVARKDIGRGKLLDRQTVFVDRVVTLLRVRFVENILSGTMRRSIYMCLITMVSPSSSISEGASARNSSSNSR